MAKRWVIGFGALVAVLLLGVATLLLAFDPNTEKGRIVEAVRRATGRELVLAGPIRLQWGLVPVLDVEDAAFANMPTGSRPQMATIARLEARVKLLPLLSRRVEIDRIVLIRPDILLETDAQGRGNWQFDRPAAAPSTEPSVGSGNARTELVLHALQVQDGRLTWHDAASGRSRTMDLPRGELTVDGSTARVDAAVAANGVAGRVSGTVGIGTGPIPIKLALAAGAATAALDGTADPAARAFDGLVDAAIPDLQALRLLLQRPDLPPLHEIRLHLDGHWIAGLPQIRSGTAHLGPMSLPGFSLATLDAAAAAGQPVRVTAEGTMRGAAWQLATGAVPAGSGVALRGFSLRGPMGDLSGDVALASLPRPSLRGTVVSQRLDLDALVPPPAPVPSAPAPAVPAPASQPAPQQPRSFDLAPLLRGDLDLQLSVALLRAGGMDWQALSGHLVLKDGVLRLDPFGVRTPGGQVDASASLDAAAAPPRAVLNLRAAGLALDPALRAFGLPGGSDGSVQLDAALSSAGSTPGEMLAHLNGHAGLAMVDGELSNAVLAATLGDVLRAANAGIDPAGRTHLRCLALRADAADGQVTVKALKLDSSRLLLDGSGTIDLASRTLALRLRPVVRLGGAGLLAPVRLDGAWQHPAVAMDAPGAPGRVGMVLGAGGSTDCGPDLLAARDGRAGPMPAVAAADTKPADLLRKLLR